LSQIASRAIVQALDPELILLVQYKKILNPLVKSVGLGSSSSFGTGDQPKGGYFRFYLNDMQKDIRCNLK
jgi:hypothetical protein